MKPTLLLSAFLIACGTGPAFAEESVVIVPVEKEIPAEEESMDDESTGEEESEVGDEGEVPEIIEDPAPGDWFPGGWNPDWVKRGDDSELIHYTSGIGDEDA